MGGRADAAMMIGINFVGNAARSLSEMDPSEVAGVEPQAHWNNAVGDCKSLAGLVDEQGVPTGVSITWWSKGTYNAAIVNGPGDKRLMRGYITLLGTAPPEAPTVTVEGLAAVFPHGYEVLVYFDGYNESVAWGIDYHLGGAVRTGTDPAGTNFSGAFVEDTGSGGNYLRFGPFADNWFTLTAVPQTGTTSAAINAIQILHVPEPASAMLLVAGLGLLMRLRRRL
ncbi:MAG TPA: PEP-CTERM sorting domain-containing protein [Phycisphaerae bacterium]|nr:PEP-CTERM sorting domain-containing protein [Phycisphaerae bacterium]